jgi:hypothetical protein
MTVSKSSDPSSSRRFGNPEPLEQFGTQKAAEAPVCDPVYENIASVACHAYVQSPTRDLLQRVRSLLVYRCGERDPKVNAAFEYLNGAATALNPLPLSTPLTFLPSDRMALASDARAVRRDLGQVWYAFSLARTLAESISNERTKRQERQRQTESE